MLFTVSPNQFSDVLSVQFKVQRWQQYVGCIF